MTARGLRPLVLLAVLAALIPATPTAWAAPPGGLALVTVTPEVETTMPDVTELTRGVAEETLTDMGLKPAAFGGTGSSLDVVESQAPTGGFPVLVGSTVKIFLRAAETVPPPPVTQAPPSPSVRPTTPSVSSTEAPAATPAPPTKATPDRVPDWVAPGLVVVAVVMGGWLIPRGARARRERRWVAEHVHASAWPGEVHESTSDQPGASPSHSIRALPHPAVVDERVEIEREDPEPA